MGGDERAAGFPEPEAALISPAALPEVQQSSSRSYCPGRAVRMFSSPPGCQQGPAGHSWPPLARARAVARSPRADFPALELHLFEFLVLAWS